MSKMLLTVSLAGLAAVVAGGATFLMTGAPSPAQAEPPIEATLPNASPVESGPLVEAPEPPRPLTVEEEALEVGLTFDPTYAGDRANLLRQFKSSLASTKASLLNHLNDPGSAQFKHVYLVEKYDFVIFCGLMNAKNAMGGYVPFRAFYGLGSSTYIDDNSEAFSKVVAETCFDRPRIADVQRF